MKKLIYSIFILILSISFLNFAFAAQYNVDSCQDLNKMLYTYTLIKDLELNDAGTCFKVTNDVIALNCNGHKIIAKNKDAILVDGTNHGLRLENCVIEGFNVVAKGKTITFRDCNLNNNKTLVDEKTKYFTLQNSNVSGDYVIYNSGKDSNYGYSIETSNIDVDKLIYLDSVNNTYKIKIITNNIKSNYIIYNKPNPGYPNHFDLHITNNILNAKVKDQYFSMEAVVLSNVVLSYYVKPNNLTTPNIIGGPAWGGNYWTNTNKTGYSDICSPNSSPDYNGFCSDPYKVNSLNTDDNYPLTYKQYIAPDLYVNNIEISEAYKGETTKFRCVVKSNKDYNNSFKVNLSIIKFSGIFPIKITDKTLSFNNLNADDEATVELEYTFNETGKYYADCFIEANDDQSNNHEVKDFNVLVPQPDLAVRVDAPDYYENKEKITVTCNYANLGNAKSVIDSNLYFYVNGKIYETYKVPSLNPGATGSKSFDLTMPETTDKDYNFTCVIDYPYSSNHNVPIYIPLESRESNISNNSDTKITEHKEPPEGIDIKVNDIDLDEEKPKVAEKVSAKCEIENIGTEDANNFDVLLYVNNDLVNFTTIDNLEAKESKTVSLDFYAPYSDENLVVECKADIDDEDHSNNSLEKEYEYTIRNTSSSVNLRINNIDSPDEVDAGERIYVDCDYENKGQKDAIGDIEFNFYVNGEKIADKEMSEISAGEIDSVTFVYTLPLDYNERKLTLACEVNYDEDGTNYETETSDNYFEKTIKTNIVEDNSIDLEVLGIDITNTETDEISNIRCAISNKTENIAKDFTIELYIDDKLVDSKIINEELEKYDNYIYSKNYIFKEPGKHVIECKAIANNDNDLSNNTATKTIDVIKKETNSENEANTNINYNPLPENETPNYEEPKVILLKITDLKYEELENGKIKVKCSYKNIGNTAIDKYDIAITANTAIKDETTKYNLATNSSETYSTIINAKSGQRISCIIITDNKTYTKSIIYNSKSNSNLIFITLAIVIIIALIAYIIIRFR